MNEESGLTSIASYFARGKYGSSTWRGNCSGLLIKDLLQFYKPDTFADLAVGSGTSIEVAADLGYTKANTIFSDLNPQYGGVDLSDSHLDFPLMDFIFFHPPYYVFPGSSMPVYSGKEKEECGEKKFIQGTAAVSVTPWNSKNGLIPVTQISINCYITAADLQS